MSKTKRIPQLGDRVTFKAGINGEKETPEFIVTGLFTRLSDMNDITIYADFEGNESDILEYDITNIKTINGESI